VVFEQSHKEKSHHNSSNYPINSHTISSIWLAVNLSWHWQFHSTESGTASLSQCQTSRLVQPTTCKNT